MRLCSVATGVLACALLLASARALAAGKEGQLSLVIGVDLSKSLVQLTPPPLSILSELLDVRLDDKINTVELVGFANCAERKRYDSVSSLASSLPAVLNNWETTLDRPSCSASTWNPELTDLGAAFDALNAVIAERADKDDRIAMWIVTDAIHDPQNNRACYRPTPSANGNPCDETFVKSNLLARLVRGLEPIVRSRLDLVLLYVGPQHRSGWVEGVWTAALPREVSFTFEDATRGDSIEHLKLELLDRKILGSQFRMAMIPRPVCSLSPTGRGLQVSVSPSFESTYSENVTVTLAAFVDENDRAVPLRVLEGETYFFGFPRPLPLSTFHLIDRQVGPGTSPTDTQTWLYETKTSLGDPIELVYLVQVARPPHLHWVEKFLAPLSCAPAASQAIAKIVRADVLQFFGGDEPFTVDFAFELPQGRVDEVVPDLKPAGTNCAAILPWPAMQPAELKVAPRLNEPLRVTESAHRFSWSGSEGPSCTLHKLEFQAKGSVGSMPAPIMYGRDEIKTLAFVRLTTWQTMGMVLLLILPSACCGGSVYVLRRKHPKYASWLLGTAILVLLIGDLLHGVILSALPWPTFELLAGWWWLIPYLLISHAPILAFAYWVDRGGAFHKLQPGQALCTNAVQIALTAYVVFRFVLLIVNAVLEVTPGHIVSLALAVLLLALLYGLFRRRPGPANPSPPGPSRGLEAGEQALASGEGVGVG